MIETFFDTGIPMKLQKSHTPSHTLRLSRRTRAHPASFAPSEMGSFQQPWSIIPRIVSGSIRPGDRSRPPFSGLSPIRTMVTKQPLSWSRTMSNLSENRGNRTLKWLGSIGDQPVFCYQMSPMFKPEEVQIGRKNYLMGISWGYSGMDNSLNMDEFYCDLTSQRRWNHGEWIVVTIPK